MDLIGYNRPQKECLLSRTLGVGPMASAMLPSPQDVQSAVEEEVADVGGRTLNCLSDGQRLFLRSVLPCVRQVRANDNIQSGIAVMVVGPDIRVHPFTYREVCRNGAIMARIIDTRRIQRVGFDAATVAVTDVLSEVREVIRECSRPEVFSAAVDHIRTAADTDARLAVHLLPMIAHLRHRDSARLLAAVVSAYDREGDNTVFGLMNAVTSVARDQRDPEVRWDLEELGGGIAAMIPDVPKPSGTAAGLLQTAVEA